MGRRSIRLASAAAIAVALLASCATIHSVRPLARGQQAVNVDVCGPLVMNLGFPTPIPLVGVNYLYGLTDRVSVGGTAYVTDALFGTGHIEANSVFGLLEQHGGLPALSLGANLHLISDLKTSVEFFPELDLTPSWAVGPLLFYGGAGAMINPYPTRAAGLSREYLFIPSFYLGLEWSFGRFAVAGELKYINPWQPNFPYGPSYVGIGEWGVFSPFIGVTYALGGGR